MSNYEPTLFFREIASRLRGQIARFDLNQGELATLCDVSQSQFSKIIRGSRPMTVDQLAVLCDALGLSMTSLVTEVEEFVADRLAHPSPIQYVVDEERVENPDTLGPEWLDGYGRRTLGRLDVPDLEDDIPVMSREEERALRQSEHGLAAKRGRNEADVHGDD